MKKFIIIALFVALSQILSAETKDSLSNWTKDGYLSLVLNQIEQMNWVKGGESTVSGTALLKYQFNYKKEDISWTNSIDLSYGIIKLESYSNARKNEDIIDLSSKFGHKAIDNFYYSILVNFKTQFANGFNYPNDSSVVSKFFSPAYLIFSIGMDYKIDENFTFYLSPLTGKHTYVLDDSIAKYGTYTGIPGETFKADFGAYFKFGLKKDIWENVTLATSLSLFNNYTDVKVENRANIDVDWNTSIVMKINKYLSSTIFVHAIYDHDIAVPIYETINGLKTEVRKGHRLQLKEMFGLGFSFKL